MILLDNTVLSNFAVIQQPECLWQAFAEGVGTSKQVFQEMERGVQLGRLPKCDWSWLHRFQLTDAENNQFYHLNDHLGKGEAACLSIAFHRKFKIATDDKDARRWAMRLLIPFTGTLGILAALVRQKQMTLDVSNDALQEMIAVGYHSPVTHLNDLVKDHQSPL